MDEFHDRMEEDLLLGGYSPKTREVYLFHVRKFAAFAGRSLGEAGDAEVRAFMLHLVRERKVSDATYRQARAALKFLFRQTLDSPSAVEWLPVRRTKRRLPSVLDRAEVQRLLAALQDPLCHALFTTMYASGLRIQEACRLRTEDVDSPRMALMVRNGKGGVDRVALLPQSLLVCLRNYWRICRPEGPWLFPGGTRAGHASPDTVRLTFHQALLAAGISKAVAPHALRHAFATHLLEGGTDLTVVQALMGHHSMKSTLVYTHLSRKHLLATRSPLDQLE